MVITKRITVGLRVLGKHGPLTQNPSDGTQQVREIAYGTVIRATEKGIWEVRFDFNGRRKEVRNTTLKVVDNNTGIPIDNIDNAAQHGAQTTASTNESVAGAPSNHTQSPSANNSTTPTTLSDPSEFAEASDSDSNDGATEGKGVGGEEQDGLMPNNDFHQYNIEDFLQQSDEVNVATIQHRLHKESWDKINLLASIGRTVECKNKEDGKMIWKHVESVTDDFFKARIKKEKEWLNKNSPMKERINSATEFFHKFSPRDIKEDHQTFITVVAQTNKERKEKNQRLISPPSEAEYIKLRALLIVAPFFSKLGSKLWFNETINRKKKKL